MKWAYRRASCLDGVVDLAGGIFLSHYPVSWVGQARQQLVGLTTLPGLRTGHDSLKKVEQFPEGPQ